ncbi:MAG: hypothetical protein ABFS41_05620, partial [Myxococcota bacterium]
MRDPWPKKLAFRTARPERFRNLWLEAPARPMTILPGRPIMWSPSDSTPVSPSYANEPQVV